MISERRWRKVERTLPPDADKAELRATLERIAAEKATAAEFRDRYRDCAALCDLLAGELSRADATEVNAGLLSQLRTQSAQDKERARRYGLLVSPKQRNRRAARQYEILWAWERAGGDLRTKTRKTEGRWEIRKEGDRGSRWQEPEGPVIDYFRAAAEAVLGKAPSADRARKIVQAYRRLNYGGAALAGSSALRADSQILRPFRVISRFQFPLAATLWFRGPTASTVITRMQPWPTNMQ
jgi:hypothetical protein